MTTHTPGPWRVGKAINGNWIEAGDAVAPKSIARTFYNNVGAETEDANARLIAAAPDLMEAVQNLMGLFDTPVVRRRLKDDALYPEVINQARAAIARAKGE